jgi:hypothetical protein
MMPESDLLAREAERLVNRAERRLRQHKAVLSTAQDTAALETSARKTRQLEGELDRLVLYRAVFNSGSNAHLALRPEFLQARGLMPRKK